jgi:hypothetical protein
MELRMPGAQLQGVAGGRKSVANNFFSWSPTSINLDVLHGNNGYVDGT